MKKSWMKNRHNQPKEYMFMRQLVNNNKEERVMHVII